MQLPVPPKCSAVVTLLSELKKCFAIEDNNEPERLV
jgi:hypothetical protein